MPNITLTIDFDLNYLLDLIDQLSEEKRGLLYRRVEKAVENGADILISNWADEATVALPGSKGGYANSIFKEPQGWAHIAVINNHPAAVYLEKGIDAFDLKKMLQTSSKVKISKDGKRYMHIPFEHSREELIKAGTDPREISGMKPSTRDPRAWGDKLTDFGNVGRRRKYFTPTRGQMEKQTVDYEWKISKFENTYKFEDTKTGQTAGFKSFRTISENSDPMSWIHPGIRAMNIAGNAVEKTRPMFYRSISEVVERTLRESGFRVSA